MGYFEQDRIKEKLGLKPEQRFERFLGRLPSNCFLIGTLVVEDSPVAEKRALKAQWTAVKPGKPSFFNRTLAKWPVFDEAFYDDSLPPNYRQRALLTIAEMAEQADNLVPNATIIIWLQKPDGQDFSQAEIAQGVMEAKEKDLIPF